MEKLKFAEVCAVGLAGLEAAEMLTVIGDGSSVMSAIVPVRVGPPDCSANVTTIALPAIALAQNAFDGRSCDSQAA